MMPNHGQSVSIVNFYQWHYSADKICTPQPQFTQLPSLVDPSYIGFNMLT